MVHIQLYRREHIGMFDHQQEQYVKYCTQMQTDKYKE